MKTFDDLDGIVQYMLRKHKSLKSNVGGATSYKLIRKPDGRRILFEESRGFKIIKFDIRGENILSINQLAAGYSFKGSTKQVLASTIFLQDLILVNVYDYRAEFFSSSSIDFAYIVNEPGVAVQMLQEWISDDPGIIRAQWTYKDELLEQLLDEISIGRRVEVDNSIPRRHIDMSGEEF